MKQSIWPRLIFAAVAGSLLTLLCLFYLSRSGGTLEKRSALISMDSVMVDHQRTTQVASVVEQDNQNIWTSLGFKSEKPIPVWNLFQDKSITIDQTPLVINLNCDDKTGKPAGEHWMWYLTALKNGFKSCDASPLVINDISDTTLPDDVIKDRIFRRIASEFLEVPQQRMAEVGQETIVQSLTIKRTKRSKTFDDLLVDLKAKLASKGTPLSIEIEEKLEKHFMRSTSEDFKGVIRWIEVRPKKTWITNGTVAQIYPIRSVSKKSKKMNTVCGVAGYLLSFENVEGHYRSGKSLLSEMELILQENSAIATAYGNIQVSFSAKWGHSIDEALEQDIQTQGKPNFCPIWWMLKED